MARFRHRIEIPATVIIEVDTDSEKQPDQSDVMDALENYTDEEDGITIRDHSSDKEVRVYPTFHPTKPNELKRITRVHYDEIEENVTA